MPVLLILMGALLGGFATHVYHDKMKPSIQQAKQAHDDLQKELEKANK